MTRKAAKPADPLDALIREAINMPVSLPSDEEINAVLAHGEALLVGCDAEIDAALAADVPAVSDDDLCDLAEVEERLLATSSESPGGPLCDSSPRARRICGAATRAGGRCGRPAMRGRARCDLHGGKSTGPPRSNDNRTVHGVFSDKIFRHERARYLRMAPWRPDTRLALLQLQRAADYALDPPRAEEARPGMFVAEVTRTDATGRVVEHRKYSDPGRLFLRALGRAMRLLRGEMEEEIARRKGTFPQLMMRRLKKEVRR